MLSHFYKKTQKLVLLQDQNFEDSQKLNHLKIELAVVVDWGAIFVKATYNLEGDGPLALMCYETI